MTPPIALFNSSVHPVKFTDLLSYIRRSILYNKRRVILPLNIHIVAELIKTPSLQRPHSMVDIIFADGVPLIWLSHISHTPIPERISGTDLLEKLLQTENGIFLLGSTPETLRILRKMYKKNICGSASPSVDNAGHIKANGVLIRKINSSHTRILLVGFGSLKQEWWILNNMKDIQANIIVGIGGGFDIASGKIPRAPKWMQTYGLEWAWRVYYDPKKMLPRYVGDIGTLVTFYLKRVE